MRACPPPGTPASGRHDTLCEGAVEKLEAFLETASPDILVMRSFGSRAERYPWAGRFPERMFLTKNDIAREGYVRGSVCGCAFRREYLKDRGVRFDERLSIAEDTVFFANTLTAGGSVVFADIPFYRVFERQDSAYRTRDEGFLRRITFQSHIQTQRSDLQSEHDRNVRFCLDRES